MQKKRFKSFIIFLVPFSLSPHTWSSSTNNKYVETLITNHTRIHFIHIWKQQPILTTKESKSPTQHFLSILNNSPFRGLSRTGSGKGIEYWTSNFDVNEKTTANVMNKLPIKITITTQITATTKITNRMWITHEMQCVSSDTRFSLPFYGKKCIGMKHENKINDSINLISNGFKISVAQKMAFFRSRWENKMRIGNGNKTNITY